MHQVNAEYTVLMVAEKSSIAKAIAHSLVPEEKI